MLKKHDLSREDKFVIRVQNKPLEKVTVVKLLGIIFNQTMTWNDHVQKIISSSYATLRSLRGIKKIVPYHLKKSLIETLILSKLDYGNELLFNAPQYLIKRLQKVQNAAAGYTKGHFSDTKDVIDLKWLPISERIEHSMCKLAYKSLHFENFPEYLKNRFAIPNSSLRDWQEMQYTIERSWIPNTFSNDAGIVFNNLPKSIRSLENFNEFKLKSMSYLLDKALAKVVQND